LHQTDKLIECPILARVMSVNTNSIIFTRVTLTKPLKSRSWF